MTRHVVAVVMVVVAVSAPLAWGDDITDSSRFLCAAVQAMMCVEDGGCVTHVPWNLNVPDFIEVDLEAKRLATTAASGEHRATGLEHLSRGDGFIVFHGFENGRAFSFVIDEASGRFTVALATDGTAVAVFGTCTPMAPVSAAEPGGETP